jgi:hypothetical protein
VKLFDWAMFLIFAAVFVWLAVHYPFMTWVVAFTILICVRAVWGLFNDK